MAVVDKRGAFYTWNETRLGQGRENAKQYLRDNPELCEKIEHQVREVTGLLTKRQSESEATAT